MDHRSTEQELLAEVPTLDSESQLVCDLVEPLQLDDFAMLYVERATALTNYYWHSSGQDLPMAGS